MPCARYGQYRVCLIIGTVVFVAQPSLNGTAGSGAVPDADPEKFIRALRVGQAIRRQISCQVSFRRPPRLARKDIAELWRRGVLIETVFDFAGPRPAGC